MSRAVVVNFMVYCAVFGDLEYKKMDLYCVRLAKYPSKSSRGRGQEKRSKTYLSCTRNRKFNLEADSYSDAWKKWKLELPERDAIFRNWSAFCVFCSLFDFVRTEHITRTCIV